MPLSQPEIEPQEQPEISEPTTPRAGLTLLEGKEGEDEGTAEAIAQPEAPEGEEGVYRLPVSELVKAESKLDLERQAEVGALAAEISGLIGQLDRDQFVRWLADYFKRNEIFPYSGDEARSKEVANEIYNVEEKLCRGFDQEIDVALETPEGTEPVDQESILQAKTSARESLFRIIIEDNNVSGEDILQNVTALHFKKTPGAETRGSGYASEKTCASVMGRSGKGEIYFYDNYRKLSELPDAQKGKESQRHLVAHELGHVLMIWPVQVKDEFDRCVADPNRDRSFINKYAPDLAYLLEVVDDPQSHQGIWNVYIEERLQNLINADEGKKLNHRRWVAEELIAETVSYHLEAGRSKSKNEETDDLMYLRERMKFSSQESVRAFFERACKTDEMREEVERIFRESQDESEIIKGLSKYPALAEIFVKNTLLRRTIDWRFSQDIGSRYEHSEDGAGWIDNDFGDFSAFYSNPSSSSSASGRSDDPALKLWSLITGVPIDNSPSMIEKVLGGGAGKAS